jgi:predicted extracellular nuclease
VKNELSVTDICKSNSHSSFGSGLASPKVDATVTAKCIGTAKIGSRNVFIQDVNGGGDDTTSDAILVYGTASDSSSVSMGDLVEVPY